MSSSKARQESEDYASATELANNEVSFVRDEEVITIINTSEGTVKSVTIREFLESLSGATLPGAVLVSPLDEVKAEAAMAESIKKSFKGKRRMRSTSFFVKWKKKSKQKLLPFFSPLAIFSYALPNLVGVSPWAEILQGTLLVGLASLMVFTFTSEFYGSKATRRAQKLVESLMERGYLSYSDYVSNHKGNNELLDPSLSHEELYKALELFAQRGNVTGMFTGVPFGQDLSEWDVSSVTSTSQIFNNPKFDQQSIADWDVSSVTKDEITSPEENKRLLKFLRKSQLVQAEMDELEKMITKHIKDS